jgi:hypothetical protein
VPNLTPSLQWPTPLVAADPERGPVLVTVEYDVAADRSDAFAAAMNEMRRIRLRDGAIHWGLFEDAAHPGRWLEVFELESWIEHLRQHERVTEADRAAQDRVRAFHTGERPPLVSHLVGPARTR